jgi:hypothetical protein
MQKKNVISYFLNIGLKKGGISRISASRLLHCPTDLEVSYQVTY